MEMCFTSQEGRKSCFVQDYYNALKYTLHDIINY